MTSADPQPALLECDRVSKVFCARFEQGRRYALRDILRIGSRRVDRLRAGEQLVIRSFSVVVRVGENVVVLGMPGSGKTTIAKLLTGMLRPDDGRIRLRGRVGLIVGGRLGMNPFLTVWEYAQIATSIHGAEPDVADACCEEVLEITGLSDQRDIRLVDVPKSRLRYLSLASALVVPQDVRVFDGVPGGGDDPVARRVGTRARQTLEQGGNLIFSSTTAGLPPNVSHAMILHDGETLYEGSAETVAPIYDHFVYRIRRAKRVEERRRERGAAIDGVPAVQMPTPAALIRRAVRGLDRSKIALLVEDRVAKAWRGDQPVILGPYLSDVGLELLYWRPFVAWMRDRFGPRSAPVVAVSRGRVGDWYAGLASEYIDVCDLVPLDVFLRRNQERIRDGGSGKQTVITDFDRELLDGVAQRLGMPDAAVLHPSLIFRVCSKIWHGTVPASWLAEHARYQPVATLPAGPDDGDTEPYVAASFWFNSAFPDSRRNRRLVHDALSELSRRLPVVVVDPGGFPGVPPSLDTGERIRVVAPCGDTDDQLREQARAIAGARAFIGTFGGISMMAPFYNVPTLTVFGEEAGLFLQHVAVARQIAGALPDVRFDTMKATDLDAARLGAWIDQVLQ